MDLDHPDPSLSPQPYDELFDAAKRRATQLRREAIRQAWNSVGRAIVGSVLSAWQILRRIAPHSPPGRELEA